MNETRVALIVAGDPSRPQHLLTVVGVGCRLSLA